jgi:hypothetical protein
VTGANRATQLPLGHPPRIAKTHRPNVGREFVACVHPVRGTSVSKVHLGGIMTLWLQSGRVLADPMGPVAKQIEDVCALSLTGRWDA